jgi:microtubule-associated protein 1 light chain
MLFFRKLKALFTCIPEVRKEEVMAIRNKFPTKIPVIVQKFYKENNLPSMDKSKFLVPQEITMSQFLSVMR